MADSSRGRFSSSADRPRLASTGEALAHFVLPLQGAADNITSIKKALKKTRKAWGKRGRDPVTSYEFIWIAGQCDLLLRIELDDFRLISELQSKLLAATAKSVSWIFCVPYQRPGSTPQGQESSLQGTSKKSASNPCPVSFALHLRVRRSVYSAFGEAAEREIVATIYSILEDRQSRVSGSLSYTLGWADLTVRGHFDGPLDQFYLFLFKVHSLYVKLKKLDTPKVYVFSKSLTVMGLPWKRVKKLNSDGKSKQRRAGTFVQPTVLTRVFPGNFETAYQQLTRLHTASDIHILDGKWDVRVTPRRKNESIEAADFYKKFLDLKKVLPGAGVERTQTHFFFFDAKRAQKLRAEVEDIELKIDRQVAGFQSPCRCRSEKFPAARRLNRRPSYLPKSIQTTASNVLVMFRYALRDRTNCCDAFPALQACARGLEDLLRRVKKAHRIMGRTKGKHQAQWFEILKNLWGSVESWCVQAEHVLRERTSGSFDDLFSPSDSVAAYRGSLQKILFISDNLTQQFYRRIDTPLRDTRNKRYRFATIYKPQAAMSSEPLVGVINIPARHAFSLHLILPQLWHEVGQCCFHSNFTLPFSYVTEARLKDLEDRLKRARDRSVVSDLIWEENAGLPRESLVKDTSEMFSDLLVLHYGFRGESEPFLYHLISLHLDTMAHYKLPKAAEQRNFATLFIRLFFSVNFLKVRDHTLAQTADVRKNKKMLRSLLKNKISKWSGRTGKKSAERLIGRLDAFRRMIGIILRSPKYSKRFRFSASSVETAYKAIRSEVYFHFWAEYMLDLATFIGAADFDSRKEVLIAEGGMSEGFGGTLRSIPEEAVNDYYLDLYRHSIQELLKREPKDPMKPNFDIMGALGRSAILSFYKR